MGDTAMGDTATENERHRPNVHAMADFSSMISVRLISVRLTLAALFVALLSLTLLSVAFPFVAAAQDEPGPTVDADPPIEVDIVGGVEAARDEFPFMSIQDTVDNDGNVFLNCGATLIAPTWVLTAAHCVENKTASQLRAEVGVYDLADEPDVLEITSVINHPDYFSNNSSSVNDLALLELDEPVATPPVILASPANSDVWQPITTGTTAGWGNTQDAELGYPDVLRKVDVPILTDAACIASGVGNQIEPETMVCAGETGKDSCDGDSGGPLLVDADAGADSPVWLQLGIVSFGNGCALTNQPGVYAEVPAFFDWIESHTGPLATLPEPPPDPVVVTTTCADGGGEIEVTVINDGDGFATYRITIGSRPTTQVSFSPGLSRSVTRTGFADGLSTVLVTRNNITIYELDAMVNCGPEPTPTPSPEPTPSPTPEPAPGNISPGPEVSLRVSCLAGNGRVDTNIVNTGDSSAIYRLEFASLSPRQTDVAAGDWWRSPITGRPDGDHEVIVKRNGVVISDTSITVACDDDPPQVSEPEVTVVNACRDGNGYLLFQLINPTAVTRSYVIEFDGVPNRSTSAAPFGAAVRAVTGRPDGQFTAVVRTGQTPVATMQVTVDCD